jgi:hypothetical protein
MARRREHPHIQPAASQAIPPRSFPRSLSYSLEQWERFLWFSGAFFAAVALGFGGWRLKAWWKERAEREAATAEWRRMQREDERQAGLSTAEGGLSQDQKVSAGGDVRRIAPAVFKLGVALLSPEWAPFLQLIFTLRRCIHPLPPRSAQCAWTCLGRCSCR